MRRGPGGYGRIRLGWARRIRLGRVRLRRIRRDTALELGTALAPKSPDPNDSIHDPYWPSLADHCRSERQN